MHIVTLSILVKEMLQYSLGFVLLISSGVESREQSSSPYTLTHWIDLGTWLAFCGSLWASFYSFFLRNRKDTGRVKLLLLLFSNKIISCWYNLYDNYKECANITQGLTIIIAPLWGFSSGSAVKVHLQCRKPGSIPGSGRSPGGGHGNSLQQFCLENPIDWGAWWATVHQGSQRVGHDWVTGHAHMALCDSKGCWVLRVTGKTS